MAKEPKQHNQSNQIRLFVKFHSKTSWNLSGQSLWVSGREVLMALQRNVRKRIAENAVLDTSVGISAAGRMQRQWQSIFAPCWRQFFTLYLQGNAADYPAGDILGFGGAQMPSFLRSGTKLIVLASVVALLSAILLGITQYRSLVSLTGQTKYAIEENLHETLQSMANVVGAAVNTGARNLASQTLSPLESAEFSRRNDREVEAELAAIARSHPEAAQVFVFDFGVKPPNAYLCSSRGTHRAGMYQWASDPEIHRAIELYNEAQFTLPANESKQSIFTRQEPCNSSTPKCKSVLYVFYNFANAKFAGMVLDPRYVQEKFLAGLLPGLLRSSSNKQPKFRLAVGVFDEKQREIYATVPGFRNYAVQEAFLPAFPNWRLALGYENTTIEGLARANLQKSLSLALILLLSLLAATVLVLRAAAKEMRLAQLKSAFVANVSHELKTPLALIRLFAETLELGRVESKNKAQEYYRIINSESRRLTHLIDNILDFSQMEAGKREYRFVRNDLAAVVADVIAAYKYQIESLGFELTVDIDDNLPAATIDKEAISQAVLNLLSNAVKYSPEIKKIAVRVEARNGRIAIAIVDDGIGIAPSEQERIFGKFYRVGTGLVHASRGSGLGLTIVRHIVEAHGGEILVDSALGKGSRFTILIPAGPGAVSESAAESKIPGYSLAQDPHN